MSLNIQLLRDMLDQDTNVITQLYSLLVKERELLEQRQSIGMQEIVSEKDFLLNKLAFTAKQRTQILHSVAHTTDLDGWIKFLERDSQTAELIPAWQNLTNQFMKCQAANEINGKMINRSKQTLSHLLNLIRGQVATPSLYTQQGSTTNYTGAHSVAKA